MKATKKSLPVVDIAMMVLSFISVVVVLTYFFAPVNDESRRVLFLVDTGICLLFITHFVINFICAKDKLTYFKHHWVDLIASIPVIEQLRFARILQIIRVIRMLKMANQVIVPLLKKRTESTIAFAAVLLILVTSLSAFLILIIESDVVGSNIQNAEDAIWWSLITISTVGYGDFYPVTTTGRFISAILIISGVSLFGLISGLFASSLMKPKEEEIEQTENEIIVLLKQQHAQTEQELSSLRKQIDTLQQRIERS